MKIREKLNELLLAIAIAIVIAIAFVIGVGALVYFHGLQKIKNANCSAGNMLGHLMDVFA